MLRKVLIVVLCAFSFVYCQNDETESTNYSVSTSANNEINTELDTNMLTSQLSMISTEFPANNVITLSNNVSEEIQMMTTDATVKVTIQCPLECKCAAELTDAVCTDRGLVTIPNGFSSKVKILILTSNNITEIGEDTFRTRNLFELMSLLINHNHIRSLHPNAFVVLKHLEVLDLGDNSLTVLDPSLFRHNTALITLRLDNNTHLELPSKDALINAPCLRDLNISSCNITDLPINVFSGTPTLETIDLSGNNLKELDPNVLQFLPELIEIILPTSFEPKSAEICKAYPKLQKIILFNKGNEERIECSLFTSNIEEKKVEVAIPLNGNMPEHKLNDNEDKVTNEKEIELLVNDVKTITPNFNMEIPVPAEERQIHQMVISKQFDNTSKSGQLKVQELYDHSVKQSSNAASLSGQQIDNIIIGILLTVIVITAIAIVIHLKRQKIRKFARKYRRNSQKTENVPEGEPLQNLAANP